MIHYTTLHSPTTRILTYSYIWGHINNTASKIRLNSKVLSSNSKEYLISKYILQDYKYLFYDTPLPISVTYSPALYSVFQSLHKPCIYFILHLVLWPTKGDSDCRCCCYQGANVLDDAADAKGKPSTLPRAPPLHPWLTTSPSTHPSRTIIMVR